MESASDEFLDLVRDDVLRIAVSYRMVGSGILSILGPRNVLGQIASGRDRNQCILGAMHHQCRNDNRRKNVSNIHLVVGPHQRDDRTWTCTGPLQPSAPLD